MANKRIQSQMQIDISFIGDSTKLIKNLEKSFSKLDLSSTLTKQIETDLTKGFKDTFSNLSKMAEGLGKKGLSAKQYTRFFDAINDKVEESTKIFGTLKKSISDAYNSAENKQALKDLEKYKKQLIELNKLASAQKGASTRRDTAIRKMKEETGIDYNISKRTLGAIAGRKADKKDLTKNQKDWMAANGLDENSLKRVLELLKQINTQRKSIEDADTKAKSMTGQVGVSGGIAYTEKLIGKSGQGSMSEEVFKKNMAILSKYDDVVQQAVNTNSTLAKSFSTELPRAQREAEEMAEGMKTLNEVLSQFGIAISVSTIVRAFQDITRSAFEFYKSLDSALNEIYVVSNLSSKAVNDLQDNFIHMAKNTGMALDDVTKSAVLFYQQGLSTDEVMEMTEVTSQFAKVAGIDATDAADKLTAAVNGYCLAAEDAALVADKFNKVAAASAADINELSTAFSKAAAQANQAGVGMDNYLAYIATMVEATREAPENIGTSLKTIMSRMQQVKESGTTEDGDTDVNQVETALKSVGVALRDTSGELRDLEDVFDELGPKWSTLDRNTQAYLGTIIAGTRQQSRFITLMQNWDRVLELSEDSANSAGQQALMHAKAMESIESKVQQFQVAWQEFISNLTDSEVIKGIIELMTGFVDRINSGNKPMLLLASSFIILAKNLSKFEGPLKRVGNSIKKGILKDVNALLPKNQKLALSYLKNSKEVQKHTKNINKEEKALEDLTKENDILLEQQQQLVKNTGLTADELSGEGEAYERLTDDQKACVQDYNSLGDAIQRNNQQRATHIGNINREKAAIKNLSPEIEGQKEAFTNLTGTLMDASIAFAGLAAMSEGGLSNISSVMSGILMMGSGILTMISLIDAAEWKSVILAIVKAGPVILMGAFTAIKTLIDAFGNQDKKITEQVEAMGDALEKYSNATNAHKGAKKLLEDYEELSNKIYRTQAEQEKLNDTAQELADALDIETVEDQYGNLSVSMADVTDKLEAMEAKAIEAREELIKTEQESIEKFDHNGNVDEFYAKYLKAHRADLRGAMSSIDTGLNADELATSATNVENIMTNLKNVVIDNSAEMSEAFGGAGIKWSLTEDVESMIETFNNADIDSTKWNNLYQTFDILQDKIDSISYDDALKVVEGAIQSWGKAAGLTTEELGLMTDAIMNSLYGNSNLHNTISKYQDVLDQASGDSYASKKEMYEKQLDELEQESTTFGNPFKQDDAEKEYESVQKKLRLLEEEEIFYKEFQRIQDEINAGQEYGYDMYDNYVNLQEYQNQLIEEYGFATTAEVEKAQKMRDILREFSDNSAAFFDKVGLFDENAQGILEAWESDDILTKILGSYKLGDTEGTQHLTNELVKIIQNTDDAALKEAAQEKLAKVFDNIQVRGEMSWTDLGDTLDDLSSDLRKMNQLMEDFNETGGFTLETFADLCDILDGIDLASVFDTGKMETYIAALDNLELGFDAATGTITANGEALKSLQDIQAIATQAKLEQTAQSLEADRASLQSQIYGVEAEIAANNALIEHLRTCSDAELAIDKVKQKGQVLYNNTMQQAATLTAQQYQRMTEDSNSWATAGITNAAKLGDAIKAAMTGNLGTGNLSEYLNGLISEIQYSSTGSAGVLEMTVDENGKVERDKAIAALQDYNAKGLNTISELRSRMKGIEQMQSLLRKMSQSDLSKLGTDGSGDKKELEKYIGQLKEIYNILNRIQLLEHRLSTLDAYAEVAQGKQYGDLLRERLDYNEQLMDQYEFLVSEQKKFTNGYKDFIGSVEGLEGVFDFDEFGQIIINWDKYNALQDEAIDGETTLKEKADDVYETYTEMFEELHGYFDELIAYYQTVIELQEEMVDAYVEMQNSAADAVKEIYQKILDTRLEAIDQEKEALEELREAREKARQDQQNAEDISNLQTNIQRTMMDSSGASDISFIKAQKDMNDKLEEIADDKYSEMLDNIIERLEQEQDSLQEHFDELFSNLDWLFSWLDEDIMGNESALFELLQQTDEWQQTSFIERQRKLDEWKTNFETYYQSMTENEKGIYGIYDNITDTRTRIAELDKNLQTSISKGSSQIATTIANWQSKTSSNNSSSGGGGNTTKTSSGGGLTTDPYNPTITKPDDSLGDTSKKETNPYADAAFQPGTKVRPKVSGLSQFTQAYEWDGKAMKKSSTSYLSFKGSNANGFTVKEGGIKLYNGQYYYQNGDLWIKGLQLEKYKKGGFVDYTGPAWLDGTPDKPEAVLNALQTEHFIKFTNMLDNMFSSGNISNPSSTVSIDTISFNVESMSSPEDGEAAFNMFVNKFKEIGSQSGIKIDSFKNRL